MSRAKFITKPELDVIRIGYSRNFTQAAIGRFLGRQRSAVYKHIQAMTQADTIHNLPMAFLADAIASAIEANEKAFAEKSDK